METSRHWQGLVAYEEALEAQWAGVARVRKSGCPLILGFEHPEVITLGVRGRATDLVANNTFSVVKVRRGGQAALHNPGQLVIYPLVPIKKLAIGVREFVQALMDATREFLAEFSILATEGDEPGLFTQKGKIAMLGVQIQGGVSLHGVAINVNNCLEDFSVVSVCGVQRQTMDRMADHSEVFSLELLFEKWCEYFDNRLQKSHKKTFVDTISC